MRDSMKLFGIMCTFALAAATSLWAQAAPVYQQSVFLDGTGDMDFYDSAVGSDGANAHVVFVNATLDANPNGGASNLTAGDGYVVMYDASGAIDWTYSPSGASSNIRAVAISPSGDVYVSGVSNTGMIDYSNVGTNTENYANGNNAYLVKLDSNGDYQWHVDATTNSGLGAFLAGTVSPRIAIDSDGSVYWGVSLNTSTSVTLDGAAGPSAVTQASAVFAKYSSAGSYQWHAEYEPQAGGTTRAGSIAVADNRVSLALASTGTLDLDPSAGFANATFSNSGYGLSSLNKDTGAFVDSIALNPTSATLEAFSHAAIGDSLYVAIGLQGSLQVTDGSGSLVQTIAQGNNNSALCMMRFDSADLLNLFNDPADAASAEVLSIDLATSSRRVYLALEMGATSLNFDVKGGTVNPAAFQGATDAGFAEYSTDLDLVWNGAHQAPGNTTRAIVAACDEFAVFAEETPYADTESAVDIDATTGSVVAAAEVNSTGGPFPKGIIGLYVPNQAPVFSNTNGTTVHPGDSANFTVTATDPEAGGAVNISSGALPGSAAFTGGNSPQTLTWTPTAADKGTHNITFTATDPLDSSLTTEFTVQVTVMDEPTPSHFVPLITTAASGRPVLTGTAVDDDGNLFVGGYVPGNGASFEMNPNGATTTYTSASNNRGFVAKYDDSGVLDWQWQVTVPSAFNSEVTDVAISSTGVYISGWTGSANTVDFDPSGNDTATTYNGASGGYLVKLDLDGNYLWHRIAERVGGTTFDGGSIAVNSNDEVFWAFEANGNGTYSVEGAGGNTVSTMQGVGVVSYDAGGTYRFDQYLSQAAGAIQLGDIAVASDRLAVGMLTDNTVDVSPEGAGPTVSASGAFDSPVIALLSTTNGNYVSHIFYDASTNDSLDVSVAFIGADLFVGTSSQGTLAVTDGEGTTHPTKSSTARTFSLSKFGTDQALVEFNYQDTGSAGSSTGESIELAASSDTLYLAVIADDFDFHLRDGGIAFKTSASIEMAVASYDTNLDLIWLGTTETNSTDELPSVSASDFYFAAGGGLRWSNAQAADIDATRQTESVASATNLIHGVIGVYAGNLPPEFGAIDNVAVEIGDMANIPVNISIPVTDPDSGMPVTQVTMMNAPAGAMLTGAGTPFTFSWSPGSGDEGEHVVTFVATDPVDSGVVGTVDVRIKVMAPPSFNYAASLDGASGDIVIKDNAMDSAGNVYVAGDAYDGFNAEPLGAPSPLILTGTNRAFAAKYDTMGMLAWTYQIDTTATTFMEAVEVDSSGNVYLAGYTGAGTLDFDPGVGNTATVFGLGGAFVIKLDASGSYLWHRVANTTVGSSPLDCQLAVDSSDDVYWAARMSGATTVMLDGAGGAITSTDNSAFVAKYDDTGAFQWQGQFGNSAFNVNIQSIATNASTGVSVALQHQENAFDVDPSGSTINANGVAGNNSIAIVRLNAATGAHDSHFALEATAGGQFHSVDIVHIGASLYAAGIINGNVEISNDAGTPLLSVTNTHTTIGLMRFIGSTLDVSYFAEATVGSVADQVSIATNGSDIYVALRTVSTVLDADRGEDAVGPASIVGGSDIFVAHYDSGLNLKWTGQTSTSGQDWNPSIAAASQSFVVSSRSEFDALTDGDATASGTEAQAATGNNNANGLFHRYSYNNPPVFVSVTDQEASFGNPFTIQITANDPEMAGAPDLNLISGPTGLSLDSNTSPANVVWNPTPAQVGVHTVVIEAVDPNDPQLMVQISFKIRVQNPPIFKTGAPIEGLSTALKGISIDSIGNTLMAVNHDTTSQVSTLGEFPGAIRAPHVDDNRGVAGKFNSEGDPEWEYRLGGGDYVRFEDICASDNDSVLISGTASGVVNFNMYSRDHGMTTEDIGANKMAFLVKLDNFGEYMWHRIARAGTGETFGQKIVSDTAAGTIWWTVAGVGNPVDWNYDAGGGIPQALPSMGTGNVASIVQYDTNGDYVFNAEFGSDSDFNEITDMDLAISGRISMVLKAGGNIELAPGQVPMSTPIALGAESETLIVIDGGSASLLYTLAFENGTDEIGLKSTFNGDNTYLVARFKGTTNILDSGGVTQASSPYMETNATWGIFEFDSNGTLLQEFVDTTKSADQVEAANAIAFDGSDIFVGLSVMDTEADLDPSVEDYNPSGVVGQSDPFLVRLNSTFAMQWAGELLTSGGTGATNGMILKSRDADIVWGVAAEFSSSNFDAVDGNASYSPPFGTEEYAFFGRYENERTPLIGHIEDQIIKVGDAISLNVTATDFGGMSGFNLTLSGQPAGMAFSSMAPIPVSPTTLDYTAVAGDVGTHFITVRAEDPMNPLLVSEVSFTLRVETEPFLVNNIHLDALDDVTPKHTVVDASGSVYTVVETLDDLNVDPNSGGSTETAGTYVLKYNLSGTLAWSYSPSTAGTYSISQVAVSDSGDVYVVGTMGVGMVGFHEGGLPIGDATTTAGSNPFVVKLNSSGAYQWHVIGITGLGDGMVGSAAATDAAGDVYFAMQSPTVGQLDVDFSAAPGGPTLVSPNPHVVLMKIDNMGVPVWTDEFATDNTTAEVHKIAADTNRVSMLAELQGDFHPNPQMMAQVIGAAPSSMILVSASPIDGSYQNHVLFDADMGMVSDASFTYHDTETFVAIHSTNVLNISDGLGATHKVPTRNSLALIEFDSAGALTKVATTTQTSQGSAKEVEIASNGDDLFVGLFSADNFVDYAFGRSKAPDLTSDPIGVLSLLRYGTDFTLKFHGTGNEVGVIQLPDSLSLSANGNNVALSYAMGLTNSGTLDVDPTSGDLLVVDGASDGSKTNGLVQLFQLNRAPVISAILPQSINEGDTLSLQITATDPDGGTVPISLGMVTPTGVMLLTTNSPADLSWMTTEDDGPGNYTIQVIATDPVDPMVTTTLDFTVNVAELNTVPMLSGPATLNFRAGMGEMPFPTIVVTDPDNVNVPMGTEIVRVDPVNPVAWDNDVEVFLESVGSGPGQLEIGAFGANSLSIGGVHLGNVMGGNSGAFVVTTTAEMTVAEAQIVLNQLRFDLPNAGALPGIRTLRLRYADGVVASTDTHDIDFNVSSFDSTSEANWVIPAPQTVFANEKKEVISLTFEDLATADNFPTIINDLFISVVVEDSMSMVVPAADIDVDLMIGASRRPMTNLGGGDYQVSGTPLLTIPSGMMTTVAFEIDVAVSNSQTISGGTIHVALDTTQIVEAANSSEFAPLTPNLQNIAGIETRAEKLTFLQQPPASVFLFDPFPLSAAVSDNNNNTVPTWVNPIELRRIDNNALVETLTDQGNGVFSTGSGDISLGAPSADSGTFRLQLSATGIGSTELSNFFLLKPRDDADSFFTEVSPQPQEIASTSGFQQIWEVDLNDTGATDGKPTQVASLGFRFNTFTNLDGDDFEWRLNIGGSTITNWSFNGTDVVFTGNPLIDVPDGGAEGMIIEASPNAQDKAVFDGLSFRLSIGAVTLMPNFVSTSLSAGGLSAQSDTVCKVEATQLNLITPTPALMVIGHDYEFELEYVDSLGYRDVHVGGDRVIVSRSDAGAMDQPTSPIVISGIAKFTMAEPMQIGQPGNVSNTLFLNFEDDAAGGSQMGNIVGTQSDPFVLTSDNDADSMITIGSTDASAIASVGGAVEIFSFNIEDTGLSDSKNTTLTGLTFEVALAAPNPNTLSDFNFSLTGNGTGPAMVNLVGNTLTFTGLNVVVADGQTLADIVTLNATMSANVPDPLMLDGIQLDVSLTDATFDLINGTSIDITNFPLAKQNDAIVEVVATEVNLLGPLVNAIDAGQTVDIPFELVDANGNRDLDADHTMEASISAGNPSILDPVPTQVMTTDGLGSFSGGSAIQLGSATGVATISVGDLTDLGVTAATHNVTVSAKAEFSLEDGPNAEPNSHSSVDASEFVLLDFRLADGAQGQPDTLDSSVTALDFDLTASTANLADFTFALYGPGLPMGGTAGTVAGTRVVFAGLPIVISDGTGSDFELKAAVKQITLASQDNQRLRASLSTSDITLDGDSSTVAAANTTNNLLQDGVRLTVAVTEMRFVGGTPNTANTGDTIAYVIEVTDANGNRDFDMSAQIQAALSGGGAASNSGLTPSMGVADFGAAGLSFAAPGVLDATLTFSSPGLASLQVNPFDLVAPDDANSQLAHVSDADALSSVAGYTTLWTLSLTDNETSDGKATTLTDISFNIGAMGIGNTTSDVDWRIAGVVGNVNGSTVSFSGLNISAGDNGNTLPNPQSTNFQLEGKVKASVTSPFQLDGLAFSFSIINVSTSAAGTSLANVGFPAKPDNVTIGVVATQLSVATPLPTQMVSGRAYDLGIEYVDANGNRDTDVSGDQLDLARGDAGTILAGTPFSSNVNGLAETQARFGGPIAAGISLTVTDRATETIDLSAVPLNLGNVEIVASAEIEVLVGPEAEATLISSIDNSAVQLFDFEVLDGGVDALNARVGQIAFDLSGSTMDLSDGTFSLESTTMVISPLMANAVGTTLTFSNVDSTVNDGTVGTFKLFFTPNVGSLSSEDHDAIKVALHSTDITLLPGGSQASLVTTLDNGATGAELAVVATEFEISQQPANGVAGNTLGQDAMFRMTDVNGLLDKDRFGTITVAIQNDASMGNTMLQGTKSLAVANGLATANDLRIDFAATGYTLRFSSPGLGFLDSAPFDVIAGDPNSIIITPASQLVDSTAGANLVTQPSIQVIDAFDNVTPTGGINVTAAIQTDPHGMAVLSGNTSAAINAGSASFTDLRIDQAAEDFVLRFTATLPVAGMVFVDSDMFDIGHSTPAALTVETQPSGARGGEEFDTQPVIQVRDAFGNPVTTHGVAQIDTTQSAGPNGANLSGTTSAAINMGQASFADLSIDLAGPMYQLNFSTTIDAVALNVDSAPFNVDVGAAASMMLTQQPSDARSGEAFVNQPAFELRDLGGNLITNNELVTAIVVTSPAPGVQLTGATEITAVNGVGAYNDLVLTLPGQGFVLRFLLNSNTNVRTDSMPFDVIARPALTFMAMDDHNNNGQADPGDVLYFHFNDALDLTLLPNDNLTGGIDNALGRSFGLNATLEEVNEADQLNALGTISMLEGTVIRVTLAPGENLSVGQTTIIPNDTVVRDLIGFGDMTPAPFTIPPAIQDAFAPSGTISVDDSMIHTTGPITITATFDDDQSTAPLISINGNGTQDTIDDPMTGFGKNWTYTYVISPDDGSNFIDGTYMVTVQGENDAGGNAFVAPPAASFVTDTIPPQIVSFTTDRDCYAEGHTITVSLQSTEPGLDIEADLSSIDQGLPANAVLSHVGGNLYQFTSAALSNAIVQASYQINATLSDGTNSAMANTTIGLRTEVPVANALYSQPVTTVAAASVLRITLNADAPLSQAPQVTIDGGAPVSMEGTAPSQVWEYDYVVPFDALGDQDIVISNIIDCADLVGANLMQSINVVDDQEVLSINAGEDVVLNLPGSLILTGLVEGGDIAVDPSSGVWTQLDGPVTLNGVANANLLDIRLTVPGHYNFAFTIFGGSDIVKVTLTDTPPQMDAGRTISLDSNAVTQNNQALNITTMGLAGNYFDVNGDTTTPVWRLLSGPMGGNLVVDSVNSFKTDLLVTGGNTIVPGSYEFELSVTDNDNNIFRDVVFVMVTDGDKFAPSADAGLDQIAALGATVMLDGSRSLDPNAQPGDVLTYNWQLADFPMGSLANIVDGSLAIAEFVPDVTGVYEFLLQVTDVDGFRSATDSLRVTVHSAPTNSHVPAASFLLDFNDKNKDGTINIGEEVTLDGSISSDIDFTEIDGVAPILGNLTYLWEQVAGPVAIELVDPRMAIQVMNNDDVPLSLGRYAFELTVSDGGNASAKVSVEFFVLSDGREAPAAHAGLSLPDDGDGDFSLTFVPAMGVDGNAANSLVELIGSNSFSSFGIREYRWTQLSGPSVAITNPAAANASFAPREAGVYTFSLEIIDAVGMVSNTEISIAVSTYHPIHNPTGNAIPSLSVSQKDFQIKPGATAAFDATASDANVAQNPTIIFEQTGGSPTTLLVDGDNYSLTTNTPGLYVYRGYADDGTNRSLPVTVKILVRPQGASAGGGEGGGGGCAISSSSEGSYAWMLLLFALGGLALWRRRQEA